MPTQAEIADHLGLNQSEVSRHMHALAIDWRAATMAQIRHAYIAHLQAVAARLQPSVEVDLTRERALTERVDRELKELSLAEKASQLVRLDQLTPALRDMAGAFRQELQARDRRLKDEIDRAYAIDCDLLLIEQHSRNALAQLERYAGEHADDLTAGAGAAGPLSADYAAGSMTADSI